MTKAKKVVALMLAFMMIFSSVSVLASAWDVTVDDGSTLEIGTKFFKQVNGEWVETTKVRPGDVVKARVYLGTDYYSNDSTLLFFYDKDFFTHAYGTLNSLEVNDEAGSFAAVNGVSGSFSATPNLNSMVSNGYIDSAFLNDYNAFLANVKLGVENNVMYDNSTWLFEFTLTVSDTASGSGDLFVKDTTIQNTTTQTKGKVNVPKGPADGTASDAYAMWLWDATPVLSSQPVSTVSSVTFNANTGVFADSTETYVVSGQIDSAIDTSAIPAISKEGYTFLGWTDELGNDVPTPTKIPENDLVLNAKWIKNVNITFNTDGGSEIPEITNVTPNTEFAKPENPTKSGYTFVGWDVRGGQLPDVYPETDTTYTAIWALDVTVSFDTLGGTEIAPMNGYAGESFNKEAVPAPTKEGHTFIYWSPALPDVFPDQSTTYTAVYETNTYLVKYFVNGTEVASSTIEYGSVIPTDLPVFDVPEGQQLSGWYTDESLSTPLATGAKMGVSPITLYATTSDKVFDAVFDANGGAFSDGSDTKTVSAIYGTGIVAPENPTRDHYEFLGWEPDSMIMDSEGKTFKAIWGIPTYTVEYYSDGALVESFTIEAGQSVEHPVNPYKTGYKFVGWTDVEGSTTPVTIPDVMPESDLTYYAIFEIRQYTITFKETGESVIDPITQDYNSAVVAPEDPVKTGYTFTGWADKNGNIVGVPATMPAKNTTLTAQWQINQYTITFADTGDTAIPAITQDYGTDVTAPENPTKTGYTFAGWDTEIPATMPAGDMTITAQWTVNQYTITFADTGDTVIAPITQDYGTAITAPENPTKTGYTFAGWDTEIPSTMPAGDMTITAQWTINQYTITFADTGDSVIAPITQDYGTAITAPENPTRVGYTFAGWDNEVPATMPAGDMTITAQWTANTYDAVFMVDGSVYETVPTAFDAQIVAPAEPTKAGYEFIKWTPEVGIMDDVNGKTFTAVFEANAYSVEYIVNGKSVGNYSLETGAVIPTTVTSYTTPVGYEFDGWYTDEGMTVKLAEGATVADSNVTLYASETAKVYDAVFDANGGAFADASTSKTVPTAFDAEIVLPDEPTMEGYTFAGWDPEPATMDAEGKTFTAIWVPTEGAYVVKYIVDGAEYETFNLAVGQEMEKPVNPYKQGWKFMGWTDTEGSGTVVTLPTTMPAQNLTYYAVFSQSSFTVTYKTYVLDADGRPTNAGVDYKDCGTQIYNFGETIVPVDAPEIQHYTFAGWFYEDGTEFTDGTTMGSADLVLYAHYDRVAVKLIPKAGSVTVIERDGTVEKYADNSVTTTPVPPKTAGDYDEFYVYGMPSRIRDAKSIIAVLDVVGDGTITVTKSAGGWGTGSIIKVTDNVTGEVVEQFYVVIFGDLNGDTRINAGDEKLHGLEVDMPSWSNRRTGIPYMIKAADLNGDRRINAGDTNLLAQVIDSKISLDQTVGKVG